MDWHVVSHKGSRRSAAATLALIGILAAFLVCLLPPSSFAEPFTARQIGDFGNVTVMEATGNFDAELPDGSSNTEARLLLAQEFYRTHQDDYDFLVFFTNFDYAMPPIEIPNGRVNGFYTGVKNDVQGIGLEIFDNSSFYGSAGRLQGTIDMGNLAHQVADPLNPEFETTLMTLVHETLHRWSAHARFKDASGQLSNALLGQGGAHWSYLLDTQGSVQYGSRWRDNGNGTFTALESRTYYSPLDLYLMGIIGKEAVPPMLLIDNPAINPQKLPEPGVTISGTARTVTIDEIIAAEGERVPSAAEAQKSFKTAFIYLTSPGTFDAAELKKLETVRNGFLTRFSILTDGQGLVQVAPSPLETLPANPGVVAPVKEARTVPPSIEEGVAWLKGRQQAEGSWRDSGQTEMRDTVEAIAALRLFDGTAAEVELGTGWLAAETEANTDYLARKIESLARAGKETSALTAELRARQNADGGWGSGRQFVSNPTDTALALKALAAAGFTDRAVLDPAIAYLQANQNPDGGWSGGGKSSLIQPTANALLAFNVLSGVYDFTEATARATAFLQSKQNLDGGFGNSPSTVYDSAAAVLALTAAAAKEPAARGVEYLMADQSRDGSWYGSPYQTAMAVQAVYASNVEPDLRITSEDISFIPEKVTKLPTGVVISATIENLGRTDVPQATVALYAGEVCPENLVESQTAAFPAQSSTVMTFALAIENGNEHPFNIVVDPDDLIKEGSEANNRAGALLRPEPTYDFEIVGGLSATPNPADIFRDVTVSVTVRNAGTADAYQVPVRFTVEKGGQVIDLATRTVDLPANGQVDVNAIWRASLSGTDMKLSVQADPFNAFTELAEENNGAAALLTVNSDTRPNLAVSYQEIDVTPFPALEGGLLQASAWIRNNGFSPAGEIPVDFYLGTPGVDALPVGRVTVSLAAGESVQVGTGPIPITGPSDTMISVVVDPDNAVPEILEDDNIAFVTVPVLSLPDLHLESGSMALTPAMPKEGEQVSVQVTVLNRGDQAAENVTVELRDGEISVGSQSIPLIEGKAQESVFFLYQPGEGAGTRSLTVVADPENAIAEGREDNNSLAKSLSVQDADLWLSESYISPNGDGVQDSTTFGFRLAAPATVQVVVATEGGDAVRTFAGPDLENAEGGQIVWDGLDDAGIVVEDGEYRFEVRAEGGLVLAGAQVVVDNNRKPFLDSFGTKHLVRQARPELEDLFFVGWLPDDRGGILYDWRDGVYWLSPDGNELAPIFTGFAKYPQYTPWISDVKISPDGSRIALAVTLEEYIGYFGRDAVGLILVAEAGVYDWTTVVEQRFQINGKDTGGATKVAWSPDGKRLAYTILNENGYSWPYKYDLYTSGLAGEERLKIHEGKPKNMAWSPSGNLLAFGDGDWTSLQLRFADLAGDVWDFPRPYVNSYKWLPEDRMLVEDGSLRLLLVDPRHLENQTVLVPEMMNAYLSDDRRQVMVLDWETTAQVFSLPSGESRFSFDLPPERRFFRIYGFISSENYINLEGNLAVVLANAYGDSDPRDALYALDLPTGSVKEIRFDGWINRGDWLGRKELVLSVNTGAGADLVALDVETGRTTSAGLQDDWYQEYFYRFQSQGSFLYRTDGGQNEDDFLGYDLVLYRSLQNLAADLRIERQGSGALNLSGSAADLNFAGYRLEYADIQSPDAWTLLRPPSDIEVINGSMGSWVPPCPGTFLVRLTVWDKAGNAKSTERRVVWGESAGIGNLSKSLDIFSPNSDGVKDTVELTYRVLQPVHLQFTITDDSGNTVRTFVRDHAVAGDESISWDGRDTAGQTVADGAYRIAVLDYQFFVEIDNRPPQVGLSLGTLDSKILSLPVSGYAVDARLKSWRVEYGEGANLQEWFPWKEGRTLSAGSSASGSQLLDPPQAVRIGSLGKEDLGRMGGHNFRLVGEDEAGNRAAVVVPFPFEELRLFFWDGQALYKIPASLLHPGVLELQAIETYGRSLTSPVLQYRIGDTWHDASAAIDYQAGAFTVRWDVSGVVDQVNAVRLKAVDVTGEGTGEIYSNPLPTWKAFSLTGNCGSLAKAESYLFEDLVRLNFQVSADGGVRWSDYQTLSTADGQTIPKGTFQMPLPATLAADKKYSLRMTGVGASGVSYLSNTLNWPAVCPGEAGMEKSVSYPEAECGEFSGKATFGFSIFGDGIRPKLVVLTVDTPAGPRELGKFPEKLAGSAEFDTAELAEGMHHIKAVFDYIDALGALQRLEELEALLVDRTLPQAQITSPAALSTVCPVLLKNSQGEDRQGVSLEGLALDNIEVARYEVTYAASGNPDLWHPAKALTGALSGKGQKNGSLGTWDITELASGSYDLKLKVVDKAGNVSCHTVTVTVDKGVPFSRFSLDRKLFSPQKGGVVLSFATAEPVQLDIAVYPLLSDGTTPVFAEAPTRSETLLHPGGEGQWAWDGRDPAGQVVADGLYAIVVEAIDSCGNTSRKWLPVEVDGTSPELELAPPQPEALLGVVAGIFGTATDLHIASYLLEAGEGATPQAWIPIAQSTSNVTAGLLGVWNTSGLVGVWTLRLTATDAAGNENVGTATVELHERATIIKAFSVEPRVFSPNGDGILDLAVIGYELAEPAAVLVEVVDFSGGVLRSWAAEPLSPAAFTITWDGTDTGGQIVPDGTYQVRLQASPTVGGDPQVGILTARVDTIPPAVTVAWPENGGVIGGNDVSVRGTIDDDALAGYQVELSGSNGTKQLDAGSQARHDHVFGRLAAPAEGGYTLKVVAEDAAGNRTVTEQSFTVDRTPPKLSFMIPADGEFYGGVRETVAIAPIIEEANPAGYSLRFGTGEQPADWQILVEGDTAPEEGLQYAWRVGTDSGLADGLYTLSLHASDKAAQEVEARLQLILDNTLPEAVITAPEPDGYVRASQEIRGNAFDANLQEWRLEVAPQVCAGAYQWSILKNGTAGVQEGPFTSWPPMPTDGDYCLRLTVTDKTGNQQQRSIEIHQDTLAPLVPQLSGAVSGREAIRLEWTPNQEADFAGYFLYRNGEKLHSSPLIDTTYTESALAEGDYVYTVHALDRAGNESVSNSLPLKIDLTGPEVRIGFPTNRQEVSGLVSIRGRAYSTDDFREYRLLAGEGTPPTALALLRKSPVPVSSGVLAEWETTGRADGEYTLRLEAEDILGNVSETEIVALVDNTPPQAPRLLTPQKNNSTVNLSWEPNAEPDLAGYLLYRNDRPVNASGPAGGDLSPFKLIGTSYTDSSLPDGTYPYYLFAVDRAGNVSLPSNFVEVTIDLKTPRAQIVAPADLSRIEGRVEVRAQVSDNDVASVRIQLKGEQETSWTDLAAPFAAPPYTVVLDPERLALAYGGYQLRAVATDQGKKTDPSPPTIRISYVDTTAPAVPTGLLATVDGADVSLSWEASAEADLAGYELYRILGGVSEKISSDLITDTSYRDAGLADGVYSYSLAAVDAPFGNQSSLSEAVEAKIYTPLIFDLPPVTGDQTVAVNGWGVPGNALVAGSIERPDGSASSLTVVAASDGRFLLEGIVLSPGENRISVQAADDRGNRSKVAIKTLIHDLQPQRPTGLDGTVSGFDVNLTWNPNPEPDVVSYRLFRDGAEVTGTSSVEPLSATASTGTPGTAGSMVDGDSATFWSSEVPLSSTGPITVEIALPAPVSIKGLDILWGSGTSSSGTSTSPMPPCPPGRVCPPSGGGGGGLAYGRTYFVSAWTGFTWQVIGSQPFNAAQANSLAFQIPILSDRLRIVVTQPTISTLPLGIAEIEVYGENVISGTSHLDSGVVDGFHSYQVQAVDSYGLESEFSEPFVAAVGDVVPPGPPVSLEAFSEGSSVNLSWAVMPEPDGEPVGFHLYRRSGGAWVRITTTTVTALSYTDGPLTNSSYSYRVTALDEAGNESGPSPEASVTVAAEAPAPPSSVMITASAMGGALELSWASDSSGASSYFIYRSLVSGGAYEKIGTTAASAPLYLDTGLTNGTPYYYVVSAIDPLGNEGGYSAEVFGIPADILPPAAPVLDHPAAASSGGVVTIRSIDLEGIAEPGSGVELFMDGYSHGTTLATQDLAVDSQSLGVETIQGRLSPDGKFIAFYGSSSELLIRDLVSGATQEIAGNIWDFAWSPIDSKIVYEYLGEDWGSRIGLHDTQTGETLSLTDAGASDWSPSWSKDGTAILFVSNRTGIQQAWIRDLQTGSLLPVGGTEGAVYPRLSPYGQKIAFCSSGELKVLDMGAGTLTLAADRVDCSSLAWSPDSTGLVYSAYRDDFTNPFFGGGVDDLFIFDLATGSEVKVSNSSDREIFPAWSPDNSSIVYFQGNWSVGYALMMYQDGQTTVLQEGLSDPGPPSWQGGGKIAFADGDRTYSLLLPGQFSFHGLELRPGENKIHAVATDSVGNRSLSSETLVLSYDTSRLPDVSVSAEDIFFFPLLPAAGADVMARLPVRNLSGVSLENLTVAVYLWEPAGSLRLLSKPVIPQLNAFTEETITVSFNAGNTPGLGSLIVVADPDNDLDEGVEENNDAVKDFVVAGKQGISLYAAIEKTELDSNETMNMQVSLANGGSPTELILQVRVEDAAGSVVADLGIRNMTLPYGWTRCLYSWNTGTTFAGSYRAHAVVKDATDTTVAEEVVPFHILPDRRVEAAVTTARAIYAADETVQAIISLKNSGTNELLSNVKVFTTFADSLGRELSRSDKSVTSLWPGMQWNQGESWNTGVAPPGDYLVKAQIYAGPELVKTVSAAFQVKADVRLSGEILLPSAVAVYGKDLQVRFSARNAGNVDAAGTLSCLLIDPQTLAVLNVKRQEITLTREAQSGEFRFSTHGLALKTYRLLLKFGSAEVEQTLDQAPFSVIDAIPPQITILAPEEGAIYDGTVLFALLAADDVSGTEKVEFQIDGLGWSALPFADLSAGRYAARWEPSTQDGGEHAIRFRATDQAGNSSESAPVMFQVQMDREPPVTALAVGEPKVVSDAGELYVSGRTHFTLTATDDFSGVARTEYRLSGGWIIYEGPFAISGLADGEYLFGYRSIDRMDNVEAEQVLGLVIDNTPPATSISFQGPGLAGERQILSRQTEVTLGAVDNLSGIAVTEYRYDDEQDWRRYSGSFDLSEIEYGSHTIRFRSIDHLQNEEAEKTVEISLIGIEVDSEILNLPRVLVWTEDAAKGGGKDAPAYSLDDVRLLVAGAFAARDAYVQVVSEKEAFRSAFRSGIYNVVMILDQDVPFDAVFLREMREAVYRGMGLLVSSWGNNVHPILQDMFGIDFRGSLSMDEDERELLLYDSPLGSGQSLVASGRILKTVLDGGTLAGILPGESTCTGIKSLSLAYPNEIRPGDRVNISLSVPHGKKLVPVDDETVTVETLPTGPVNRFTNHPDGDIEILEVNFEGIAFAISGTAGYLGESYTLAITVERSDGSRSVSGPVTIIPTCSAVLRAGMSLGPLKLTGIEEDRVKSGEDVPAVVLGQYGEGRTAFLSYNLIDSALTQERAGHLSLLRNATTYLLPETVNPEAGGIALFETRLKLQGGDLDLQVTDTLGEGMAHLWLFDLTQSPLSHTFHLEDGEETAWRYFVRLDDRSGTFTKQTDVFLRLDEGYVPFATTVASLQVEADSSALLPQALAWVETQMALHPEAADALQSLRANLLQLGSLPLGSAAEAEAIIHLTVQTIHQVLQLEMDNEEVRRVLDDYLRIVEGEAVFIE